MKPGEMAKLSRSASGRVWFLSFLMNITFQRKLFCLRCSRHCLSLGISNYRPGNILQIGLIFTRLQTRHSCSRGSQWVQNGKRKGGQVSTHSFSSALSFLTVTSTKIIGKLSYQQKDTLQCASENYFTGQTLIFKCDCR